jgi:hypothetical protein
MEVVHNPAEKRRVIKKRTAEKKAQNAHENLNRTAA